MRSLLSLGGVHLVLRPCDLPLGLLQGLSSLGQLGVNVRLLLPKPLQLSLAGEDPRRPGGPQQ